MKLLTVIFLAFLGTCESQYDWSYDYETQWPGVCRTGELQSPINIMTRDAILDEQGAHIRGPLVFRGYGDVTMTVVNNGRTLRWKHASEDPAPILSGGPLRGNYTLAQFHLHWLSEHAIDGMKYPLEIHMVHLKNGLTIDEAVKRPDGLAVLGFLYQIYRDDESDHALEQLMPSVPELIMKTEEESEPKNLDLTRLMSPDTQSYYTYHGSLTIPACYESVTWIVMDKPLTISDKQFKMLNKVDVGGRKNYRSLQAVNRNVYRSVGSSSILAPSLFCIFFSLFSFFTSTFSSYVKTNS